MCMAAAIEVGVSGALELVLTFLLLLFDLDAPYVLLLNQLYTLSRYICKNNPDLPQMGENSDLDYEATKNIYFLPLNDQSWQVSKIIYMKTLNSSDNTASTTLKSSIGDAVSSTVKKAGNAVKQLSNFATTHWRRMRGSVLLNSSRKHRDKTETNGLTFDEKKVLEHVPGNAFFDEKLFRKVNDFFTSRMVLSCSSRRRYRD